MSPHLIFDALAAIGAATMTLVTYRWRLADSTRIIERNGAGYVMALVTGAVIGGYGLGTLNLWIGGHLVPARSIVGALAGSILAVELFKWQRGIAGSTGLIFVPAFCTSVAIGRIGCFLSGMEDETHGTPTALPWGHDFGDGILRHPVQLYEAVCMALFLLLALFAMGRRMSVFQRSGFYIMTGFYAAQRFIWEFLKPYGTVVGPFNIFHLVCTTLLVYAFVMISRERAQLAKAPVS